MSILCPASDAQTRFINEARVTLKVFDVEFNACT